MTYRSKLRALRVKRGLTQSQLAAAVGLSPSHVSMIESGKREVRVNTMLDILDALGSSMCEFFNDQPAGLDELRQNDIVMVRTAGGVEPFTVSDVRGRLVLLPVADGPPLDPADADIVAITRHRIGGPKQT